ncbi:hypothetical protein [Parabacteroides sp. PF5-9]|uniref:hypothetical protein n=1 Tax=Parabacteroides sp. PF5-9 TaxID=1742404 RepID=UPI002474B9B7|nr:hypothetical protein [Parabacteroides sp. PF5-9]MDH6357240.1 hypothetical protein [Parabacteroides sp. PF5-9]
MDWSLIIEIIKWVVPVGGFGSVAAWFINRTERELKQIRDSHDAYKTMYEDVKQTLNEEIEEKRALRKALGKFERAISKVFGCRYYPNCPVNIELLHQQTDKAKPKGDSRQRSNKRSPGGDSDDNTGVKNDAYNSDDEPP